MSRIRNSLLLVTVSLTACIDGGTGTAVDTISASAQAVTGNPCTAVALTTPSSGFTAASGQTVALSASATCPDGQSAEFQYWGKLFGASNWTILTIVNGTPSYVTGASSYSLTDANIGNWCFEVVARAVGATEPYQVRSSATCGAVAGPSSAVQRRRNIPLALQWIDTTNRWEAVDTGIRSTSVTGATFGATSIDIPFEVGDTITGIEVWRFSDGTAAGKGAQVTLAAGNNTIIATGTDAIASDATGRTMYSVPPAFNINHTMVAGERLRLVLFAKTAPGYTIDSANLLYTPAP